MMDWDQRPDSNRHPLTSLSQIMVPLKGILKSASFLWPLYCLGLGLGHTSVTSLDVDLWKWETGNDLKIGRRFENFKKDVDLTSIWVLHIYCVVEVCLKLLQKFVLHVYLFFNESCYAIINDMDVTFTFNY